MGKLSDIQIARDEGRPISISHWGQFSIPGPPVFIMPEGCKLDVRDLERPGHIVWMREREKN